MTMKIGQVPLTVLVEPEVKICLILTVLFNRRRLRIRKFWNKKSIQVLPSTKDVRLPDATNKEKLLIISKKI